MFECTTLTITLVSANINDRWEHATSRRTHFGKPISHNLEIIHSTWVVHQNCIKH